jgi:hypothetical protein
MAKSNVPNYVASALSADRTQQVNTLSALIVYLFGEQKANREVKELGARLHKEAPHKSEKTWQNYVSTASAVVDTQTVKLESLWAAESDPGAVVPALVHWLDGELKSRKYQTSMEDVSNWARGKPSMAAKKRADDKAAKEAQEAQAKANAEAAAKAATQAEADKAARDAAAKAEADAAAAIEAAKQTQQADPLPTGDENGTAATGYPPAIETAPPAGPVFALSVARTPDGYTINMADDLKRADLQSIIDALQAQCDAMLPDVDAPAAAPAPAASVPFPELAPV